jgi:tetratricopeptide (TPR) repeat protein
VSRWAHGLLILLLVVGLWADREAFALGEGPGPLIEALLDDYEQAFATGNPLLLQAYDPQWRVFQPLLRTTWFDHVQRSKVMLSERQVVLQKAETQQYLVSLVKTQEDIQHTGLFTRGLSGIRMEVRIQEGRLEVLSHRTFPPRVAVDGYQSGDPRSWGEEHSQVERYLYRGLEYLREGDIKNAEDQVEKAEAMVVAGHLPDFLFGPAYFAATCHYYSAMLMVKRGEFPAAAERLQDALALHPDFPAALNLRAELYFNDAEHDKALELWQRSLELYAGQPAIREVVELVRRATQTGRKSTRALLLSLVNLPPSQAIQVLAPKVKKNSRDKVLVPLLAKAYVAAGDPEKALEVLEASRLVGKEVECTYLAARIALKLQRAEEALERFEQVWQADPGYRDTLVFVVGLYAGLGQYHAALAHLDAADPLRWEGTLHALKARYALMAGRFLDAVSELEKATDRKLPARVRAEVAYLLQRISRQRR